MKGYENLSFQPVTKKNKKQKGLTGAFYGCETVEKTFWFSDLIIQSTYKTVHLWRLKGMPSSKLACEKAIICQ